jgi:DNA repair exonuclease SbcCD nuclease subunit
MRLGPRDRDERGDIVVVHSSDLHVDDEASASKHVDGIAGLAAVLAAAHTAGADVLLLAGDTFDNNRVPAAVLARTADAGGCRHPGGDPARQS